MRILCRSRWLCMLLVLSITFYFHYTIWGCMCSTGPFQYRWLKRYIYSSCYHHHQIHFPITIFSVVVCLRCLLHNLLSLIAYTFRENREFVFIIIVQFMMSANNLIRFCLQIVFVCLYITPSHYYHWANLSEDIELVECVSKIKHILSVIQYIIRGAVCYQFTHFPCDDYENIYTLSYYHHQIGSMNYYPLFRVRSWNNGVSCMCFCILMYFRDLQSYKTICMK